MAVLQDPITGAKAKVNADGGLGVSIVGDGYPTYGIKIYNPRITTAIPAGAVIWAIRAPTTHSMLVKGGRLRLVLDTALATMAEISMEIVRFRSGDFTGGTQLVPVKAKPTDPAPNTQMVRHGTATGGLTAATGLVIDATTSAMFAVSVPGQAGSNTAAELGDAQGMILPPGEGIAIRGVTALPVGLTISGVFGFSEIA